MIFVRRVDPALCEIAGTLHAKHHIMAKKIKKTETPEILPPDKEHEIVPPADPEEPLTDPGEPDFVPEEDPFETPPPFEIPPPGERP